MNALLLAAVVTAGAADTPRDYSHLVPLAVSGNASVVQLQLPRDVYLNARSPSLQDIRVFDAQGRPQLFALRHPESETQTSHRALPARVFPVMADTADSGLAGLEVSTATDGRVLSVRLPGKQDAAQPRQRLAALVLDLRQEGTTEAPLVDALRFTLPPGRSTYNGQVWVEASNDLKAWEMVGVAELSWLANANAESLASDRVDFAAHPMRYARLSWRGGEPLQFASVTAQVPVHSEAPPPLESVLLPAQPGRTANELDYIKPVGIPAVRAGLQFAGGNFVLPATLGRYREPRPGHAYFEPLLRTTFYRLEHEGKPRESADIAVPPYVGERWVLRFDQPPALKPPLRVTWQPATLVFMAGGTAPYALAVGNAKAEAAERPIGEVAPGFSPAELRGLERAVAGPAQMQGEAMALAAQRTSDEAASAQRRLVVLWGVLVLGVAVVAGMVWRLLRQAESNA